jgi:DHA1 family multidrug resistance protein-like MFS transporter
VQFSTTMPLAAKHLSGTAEAVAWVYAINAGMSVLLTYPLLRLAGRWLRPAAVLVRGVGLMALGLGGVALAADVPALLACVVAIALGSLLANPSQQTLATNLADPAAYGSYVGVSALALAVGGGLGNLGGGLLYDGGQALGWPGLPWLVFAAVGLLTATGLALLVRPAPESDPAKEATL